MQYLIVALNQQQHILFGLSSVEVDHCPSYRVVPPSYKSVNKPFNFNGWLDCIPWAIIILATCLEFSQAKNRKYTNKPLRCYILVECHPTIHTTARQSSGHGSCPDEVFVVNGRMHCSTDLQSKILLLLRALGQTHKPATACDGAQMYIPPGEDLPPDKEVPASCRLLRFDDEADERNDWGEVSINHLAGGPGQGSRVFTSVLSVSGTVGAWKPPVRPRLFEAVNLPRCKAFPL